MKKVSLIVHHNYLEEVIENLHENGLMQIIDIANEDPQTLEYSEKTQIDPEATICANYNLRLQRLIDILKHIQKKKKGIKALLNPELPEIKTIEHSTLEEIYSYAEALLEEIEKSVLDNENQLKIYDEQKTKIRKNTKQVEYLTDFKIDLEDIGESEYLTIKAGRTQNLTLLKEKIKPLENIVLYSKQFGTGKKIEWAVTLAAHISEKEEFEKICREHITEFDLEELSGTPNEVLKDLNNQKKEIEKKKKQIITQLREQAKEQLSDLQAIKEEIQIEEIRKEISKNFTQTNSTYIIKGWALEKNEKTLKESLTQVSKDHIECTFKTPSPNPDNPPTYLKTPKWAEGFKGLLEMFATPKYNEINPTIIMGIFFVLFFGVMLGDAGYGLVIFILSLVGYFKFGKYSDMIRSWSFMGLWMGFVTIIVGVLTNSIFGNFFHMFFFGGKQFIYKFTLLGINFPVDSLKDPLTILSVALILGLIHLNVGVTLGLISAFKRKKYKELLTKRFCWVPLQLGGGLLIGYFILDWSISTPFFNAAGIMVIIGIILLFIDGGPVGFFDITGYVGDWLSYARLLALGLATAGMALAFNEVSRLLGEMIPVIGIVITVLLLIIMHLVNLGLSALGAGVHSLRLQYVEFFNRFYEGGGKNFMPFKMKRRYTKIDEEKIGGK